MTMERASDATAVRELTVRKQDRLLAAARDGWPVSQTLMRCHFLS